MKKDTLANLAKLNQQIWDQGGYDLPDGTWISTDTPLARARRTSVLIDPAGHAALASAAETAPRDGLHLIEVENETTFQGALRLRALGHNRILALNFASARNVGGGYLNGARAQEEALCRCSLLYPSLLPHARYYDENRKHRSCLYLDYMIWSPDVMVFREEKELSLLAEPWTLDFLTAPAPNLGAMRQQRDRNAARIPEVFTQRIGMVLNLAAAKGYRALVLGAWGCGAFQNDPAVVAGLFAAALEDSRWKGVFDKIVFSVLDREEKLGNYRAFRQALLP